MRQRIRWLQTHIFLHLWWSHLRHWVRRSCPIWNLKPFIVWGWGFTWACPISPLQLGFWRVESIKRCKDLALGLTWENSSAFFKCNAHIYRTASNHIVISRYPNENHLSKWWNRFFWGKQVLLGVEVNYSLVNTWFSSTRPL